MTDIGTEAIGLAAIGMSVFPLRPGDKRPLTEHGQNDSTTDIAKVAAWWSSTPDANIGVHCAPSGLYVVDVDCADGKVGSDTWAALTDQHGHVDTYTVRTWSGGLHFYYRMPDGEQLRNTANKLGPNVDTRGNGYVVAPPSVVNGTAYEVVNDVEVAELPQWIVDAVKAQPRRPAPSAAVTSMAAPADEVRERVRQLCEEVAGLPEGVGNDRANTIAFMIGQYVGAGQLSHGEASQELNSALAGWSFRTPSDEKGMYRTVLGALEAGQAQPRAWEASRFPKRAADTTSASLVGDGSTTTRHHDGTTTVTDADGHTTVVPPTAPSDASSDAGQARIIARTLQRLMWVPGVAWLMWDDIRWSPVDETVITKTVSDYYARKFRGAVSAYLASPTPDNEEKCAFYRKRQSKSALSNVVALLKAETGLLPAPDGTTPSARLDRNPPGRHLLNTPTGVVDLATGEVLPHDPRYLMTKVTKGRYGVELDPKGVELWRRAMDALPDLEGTYQWIWRRYGWALTGCTGADVVFLHGGGQNGKSTWSTDGFLNCLGDYGVKIARSVLSGTRTDPTAPTTAVADLRGARFAVVEELPEEMYLNTTILRDLASTGKITARKLYSDNMTFESTHSLFVNTNVKPIVNETDWGTWRRLTMVEFPKLFTRHPHGPGELRAIDGMAEAFKENRHGVWDAMLSWAVKGARLALEDSSMITGLAERADDDLRPEAVKAATFAWRRESDKLMAFHEDYLVDDPDGKIDKTDMLQAFNEWMGANGNAKWSTQLLRKRMTTHPLFKAVREARVLSTDPGLSRPPGEVTRALPRQPMCFVGVKFAPTPCTCAMPGGYHTAFCPERIMR